MYTVYIRIILSILHPSLLLLVSAIIKPILLDHYFIYEKTQLLKVKTASVSRILMALK